MKTTNLATPNNIKLLSSFINDQDREAIAKEIFGLLNKSPDEIIKHFIAKEDFDKARDLTKMFFPKSKKDREDRDEYDLLIREAICNALKKIDEENMDRFGTTEGMFLQLHLMFDEAKSMEAFLLNLKRFCMELLYTLNIYTDQVVIDMLEYFGTRRYIDGAENRQELLLNVPSALMKWKNEEAESIEDDDPPFTDILDSANAKLPEWKGLRDSERLSIFYDEENKCVSIRPNKDIKYHLSGGQDLPREKENLK